MLWKPRKLGTYGYKTKIPILLKSTLTIYINFVRNVIPKGISKSIQAISIDFGENVNIYNSNSENYNS